MGYLGNRYLVTAAVEDEFGSFNTDPADFAELCPLEEGFSWSSGGPQMLDKQLMRADAANSRAWPASRRPEIKMTAQLRGGLCVAGHGKSAEISPDMSMLLSACLGVPRSARGAGILSAEGAGRFTVSGAGSLRAGEVVWIDPDGSGRTYPRALTAVSGVVVDVWPDLPQTPQTGGVVYAACNFTPFCGPVPLSLCFEKSSALWSAKRLVERASGMAGNVSLSRVNAREQVLLKFSFEGVADEAEEASSPRVAVGAGAAAPWSAAPAPLGASGACLFIGDAQNRRHSGIEYDPGAEIKRRDDVSSPSGYAAHFISAWAEKGVLHLPWSADLKAAYDSGATLPLLWACGDAASGAALYLPQAQIMEIERESVQGEEFMKLSFRATHCAGLPSRCLALSGRRN